MKLQEAKALAEKYKAMLEPHCEKIAIAGSIRRGKPTVKDIELVCIPRPYEIGLFTSGIASVVNQWEKIRGELTPGKTKYTQRMLPEGIKLDLFFAEVTNWGLILAMRTGSAEYSHKVLATGWVKRGYKSSGGHLYFRGQRKQVLSEERLFEMIRVPYCPPQEREYEPETITP